MKTFYSFAFAALSLSLASCYEINDLEQDFKNQYQRAEFSEINFATNFVDQITFMRLNFDIDHFKNGCKLMIHYTDIKNADPFVKGDSIDISSLLTDMKNEYSYGISYELKNLMPETYYWAGFSYRDPGCETIHSRIINFKTEPIEKRCNCYDYDPFQMIVKPSFTRVPSGSAYGCLIGTESNLTLENCMESRQVGQTPIGDNEKTFKEVFSNLTPGATYYYRSYVTYHGRTYYSRCYDLTLPEVLVSIFRCQASNIDGGISASAYYVDNFLTHDFCDTWEHGFLLSETPEATYDDAARYPATLSDNLISANIFDLQPGKTYYLTAYTKWGDNLTLSDQITVSF